MVNQFTLPTLFRAISDVQIEEGLGALHGPFMELKKVSGTQHFVCDPHDYRNEIAI